MDRNFTGNRYDRVRVNVTDLYRVTPACPSPRLRRMNPYLTGALLKSGAWKRLIDAGIVRGWFDEFHAYWRAVLGGRPLRLHDFFYLYGSYRAGFQDVSLPAGNEGFLKAWQMPENLHLLFSYAYEYALFPLPYFPYRAYLRQARKTLEYGCGVAPVTYGALAYGGLRGGREYVIADLPSFHFHFARWRLGREQSVRALELAPSSDPAVGKDFDLVFLMAVIEHLPDPLAVLRALTVSLKKGGRLIFDYPLTEGKGLDTVQALRQRGEVLEFIRANFTLERGSLDQDRSITAAVARKR